MVGRHVRRTTAVVGAASGSRDERGFTLIEMVVTMSLAGILVAAAAWGLHSYSDAQAERGTANNVISSLRDVAQRAQAEGRAYCVSFDKDPASPADSASWSVWRYSCTPWSGTDIRGDAISSVKIDSKSAQGKALITSVSFATAVPSGFVGGCDSTASLGCVYFFPRGVSSTGTLSVVRSGSSATYTVHLEGLTSRAYLG